MQISNSKLGIFNSPKASGFIKYGGTYSGAYFLRRGLFMPWELPAIMGAEAAEEGLSRLDPLEYIKGRMEPDPGTPFTRVAAMEASLYMRNQLLRDADWAGMAHGLEIRLPLVDSVLLKTLAPVLAGGETREPKKVLSRVPERPLPRDVVMRSKTGFTVPIETWLVRDGELDEWKRVPLLNDNGCHWSRRWAYTIMRRFSDFLST